MWQLEIDRHVFSKDTVMRYLCRDLKRLHTINSNVYKRLDICLYRAIATVYIGRFAGECISIYQ